jgi:hypothetical protein
MSGSSLLSRFGLFQNEFLCLFDIVQALGPLACLQALHATHHLGHALQDHEAAD